MPRENLRTNRDNAEARKAQGKRLVKLFTSCNFKTATAAAEHLNVAGATFLAHANGTRQIRDDVAKRYAKAFGSTPEWILFGTEPMKAGEVRQVQLEIDEATLVGEVATLISKVAPVAPKLSPGARVMIRSGLENLLNLFIDQK